MSANEDLKNIKSFGWSMKKERFYKSKSRVRVTESYINKNTVIMRDNENKIEDLQAVDWGAC